MCIQGLEGVKEETGKIVSATFLLAQCVKLRSLVFTPDTEEEQAETCEEHSCDEVCI